MSEPDCGVVTARVRARLEGLAAGRPERFVLADSRERIGLFRQVCLKPNERECRQALGLPAEAPFDLAELARAMNSAILVDGRNFFMPETAIAAGFDYCGVGRCVRPRGQKIEATV